MREVKPVTVETPKRVSLKLDDLEVKIVVRALNFFKNNNDLKTARGTIAKQEATLARRQGEKSIVENLISRISREYISTWHVQNLAQSKLELVALEAHQAAFGQVNRFNLPAKDGSKNTLMRMSKQEISEIIPIAREYHDEGINIGYGVIKLSAIGNPEEFVRVFEVSCNKVIVRCSEWFSKSDYKIVNALSSKWASELKNKSYQEFDWII